MVVEKINGQTLHLVYHFHIPFIKRDIKLFPPIIGGTVCTVCQKIPSEKYYREKHGHSGRIRATLAGA